MNKYNPTSFIRLPMLALLPFPTSDYSLRCFVAFVKLTRLISCFGFDPQINHLDHTLGNPRAVLFLPGFGFRRAGIFSQSRPLNMIVLIQEHRPAKLGIG